MAKSCLLFLVLNAILVPSILSLNTDGILLLSFKYSILSDPLSVLENWNYDDITPCSWNGVNCSQFGNDLFRVTSLILPNSQLLGSVSKDLGLIQHLRYLDLSNNFFNGSVPLSIFNSSELEVISLSNNVISGELPSLIGEMRSLQVLNLSDNALAGKLPRNLTDLGNLTVVSLKGNYFSGPIPSGFSSVGVLDLSSNLFNGSLPLDFGGENLRYLNMSYNKFSGSISPEFAKRIPQNSTIDLSFNNLTGAIPETLPLLHQKTESFSGNLELCGKPLKNLCSVRSTLSTPPNVTSSTSISPAIAVIPKSIDSVPSDSQSQASRKQNQQGGLKPGTIAAIAVADLAGISILALIILYVYQIRKRKAEETENTSIIVKSQEKRHHPAETITKTEQQQLHIPKNCSSCLRLNGEDTSSDATTSSDSDQENNNNNYRTEEDRNSHKGGVLVTVDGETELDVDTLFKASAYILGNSGSGIVYKAVLVDRTAFAVRRIGENRVWKMKDFETQVKSIAKLKHPNLVKLRGFYWGSMEKLLIYDYASNGCLSTFPSYSKYHFPAHFSTISFFKLNYITS